MPDWWWRFYQTGFVPIHSMDRGFRYLGELGRIDRNCHYFSSTRESNQDWSIVRTSSDSNGIDLWFGIRWNNQSRRDSGSKVVTTIIPSIGNTLDIVRSRSTRLCQQVRSVVNVVCCGFSGNCIRVSVRMVVHWQASTRSSRKT